MPRTIHSRKASTWTKPSQTLTATTYDLASVQDHVLEARLFRPGPILRILSLFLLLFFAGMLATFLIPLIVLSIAGGKSLLNNQVWPALILWGVIWLLFVALPVARKSFLCRQMVDHVKKTRGVQDRYEIVPLKNWDKWARRLNAQKS